MNPINNENFDTEKIVFDTKVEGFWTVAWRSFRRKPLGMVGLIGLLLIVIFVIFSPFLAPYSPTMMDDMNILAPPTFAHPFGTDDYGRDVLSRIMWGGQETLGIAFIGMLLSAIVSLAIGIPIGYYGGVLDLLAMRVVDIFLAFPNILLVLSIVAILGPNLNTILIALTISSLPAGIRYSRGLVINLKNREFITSSRALGASSLSIMIEHLLPNMLATIIIFSCIGFGGGIMAVSGLSYLGLGAQPPSPEWGAMLSAGREYLSDGWWMAFFPGLAVSLTIVFVNILSYGLREALDPKMRQ